MKIIPHFLLKCSSPVNAVLSGGTLVPKLALNGNRLVADHGSSKAKKCLKS